MPDAQFGRNESVPPSVVEPEPALQLLHEAVLEALVLQVHLLGARHTCSNYRPHVTHAETHLLPGYHVRIRQKALVDMRPDGNPRLRRVVAVWEPE
ncbi:hypothetical protein [Paeniglutamicibacter psychrophenolicus]|uniref:hypothetical protein n=1 Tax=Paeniglutamicibacter psychrophenolicus TaxID=257454 RepID=UPI00277FFF9D|nr:hypothetical protein [Paeniglutamicibacter psychrophenolicus]MDQ0095023.1 hypothetical protein [Paeniglutamicibacter psychrophenolicus]